MADKYASPSASLPQKSAVPGLCETAGRVTCFFTPGDSDLVDAIRQSLDAGESLENAFSRRRSFKKRIKQNRKLELELMEKENSPTNADAPAVA